MRRRCRVDLYGLACVAYEALSGRPVVEASESLRVFEEKLGFIPPRPEEIGRGITKELHIFLAQGLNRYPEKRTVDMEVLASWAGPVKLDALAHRYFSTRTVIALGTLAAL